VVGAKKQDPGKDAHVPRLLGLPLLGRQVASDVQFVPGLVPPVHTPPQSES
jgi:hypothetical protein